MSQENISSKQPLIRYVNRRQMSWRAVDVEKLIGEDHPARAIWALVGRLDLHRFYDKIESSAAEGGRPAFDPQLLISLWVYAYSVGIGSAREVARRCEYDPAFQWLTGLDEVNYHTLARERARREQQERLENALQELEKLQERKQGEQAKSKARVSSSDPQARVMHHSDGGLTLSYNAQISADAAHGLIVGMAVTQDVNDCRQLLPAVDRLEARLKKKPQQMVADTGYTTRETIEAMAERKIDFLGSMVEEKKRGRPALERLPPTAFVYDRNRDSFVCPEGKLLGYEGSHTKKKGFTYYRYEAEWRDCQSCARKPQCCPENQKQGRSVVRGQESAAVLAFHQKMASEEAQAHYRRRGRVVEFCHAWIKSKLGLRQFHVRGLVKVQMEMLWACLTYNLQHWIRLRNLRPAPVAM